MSNLLEHIETYLGEINSGWTEDFDGNRLTFSVLDFLNCPVESSHVCSTLGLSEHRFHSRDNGSEIFQELLLMVDVGCWEDSFPGLLQQLAQEAISSHHAYLRGQVLGPRGKISDGTSMSCFYVAAPIHLPDEFHVYKEDSDKSVIFAWMIPIHLSEAKFVEDRGWDAFEDLLIEKGPDLLDLNRSAIV